MVSCDSAWLAAVDSSTIAAFCCVTWSIWFTAALTWSRPRRLLLRRDDAISPTMHVVSAHLRHDRHERLAGLRRPTPPPLHLLARGRKSAP